MEGGERVWALWIVVKCRRQEYEEQKNPMSSDDLSVSLRLPVGEKVHSIQMRSLGLLPGRARIYDSFPPSLLLCLFSLHRLTSHL